VRISRRGFLSVSGAGIAGVSSSVLTACGADEPARGGEPAAEPVELLNGSLAAARTVAAGYRLAADRLEGEAAETAGLFAEQSDEHADRLAAAVEELGAEPAEPLGTDEYARELRVERLGGHDELLDFAIDLESTAIAAYEEAVAGLPAGEVRRTLFEVIASSAAHVSVLAGLLGEPQVPDAFVTGART
jgi:rubrerythrin